MFENSSRRRFIGQSVIGAVSLRQRRIVDQPMLDAMLAITRADMLRHLTGASNENR